MFKRIHFVIILCLCIMLITNDFSLGTEYNSDSKIAAAITVSPAKTPVPEWTEYINKIDGYQVEVPGAWALDSSKTGTVTKLSSSDRMAVINIFAQPLKSITANEYLNYSNAYN